MKNVVIVGGTGLLGKNIIKKLSEFGQVNLISLVRNISSEIHASSFSEIKFDFDNPEEYKKVGADIPCDIFICCLGTTITKAKNLTNFYKVDRDYPIMFIENIKKNNPLTLFVFTSSIGASNPTGYYLNAKCEVEKALTNSLMPYIIVRPSILLGKRNEIRIAEKIGGSILQGVSFITKKMKVDEFLTLSKFAPVSAEKLAETMVLRSLNFDRTLPGLILEGDSLIQINSFKAS